MTSFTRGSQRGSVFGNPADIDRLVSEVGQAQNVAAGVEARIAAIGPRLDQVRARLGRAWSATNWMGPERGQAEAAFSAANGNLGRVSGAVSQAHGYTRQIGDPLRALAQALRAFRGRLR